MSSSPTATTSTTASSTSSPSPPEARPLVVACGALAGELRAAARRQRVDVEVVCVRAELHNRPAGIAAEVERLAAPARRAGRRVVCAYADCGTYGALDELCERLGMSRLAGLHCYDVHASPAALEALLAEEPGTYLLTDFLVRGFEHLVVRALGLDAYPELWPDYFGHYRRVVWLAQRREAQLETAARSIAARLRLPLVVIETGTARLEDELVRALAAAPGQRPPAVGQARASRAATRAGTISFRSPTTA